MELEQNGLSEAEKIRQEFDGDACDFCERYKRKGLSRSSRILLDFILEEKIHGLTFTDIGCGAGGFTVELLKSGAEAGVGFDISPNMVDSATKLVAENGFADRVQLQVGDAASAELSSSDIIVMDKVLCCYSDWKPLLKSAIAAGKRMIGFVIPRDEGLAKIPFRLGVRVVNFFQKRRGKILFYLHPLDLVDETFLGSGFTRRKKRGSRLWLVFLYSRTASAEC